MNTRIRSLAAQATKQYSPTYYTQEWIQGFAELIVRECADLFVDQRYMILNPLEPFANERARALKQHDKDTVRKIRQHFGVEE